MIKDLHEKLLAHGKDTGLLLARLGIGFFFFYVHGLPKVLAGGEVWLKLGGAIGNFGITFAPAAWGFMAAAAECGGGLLVLLGLLTRPAAAALTFNMLVASVMHLAMGQGLQEASHAAEAMFFFLALTFTGAGRFSLDQLVFKGRF
ncbi:MAG: DoxX family membrane protein [Elusimicrobiales bacterium]|nr:DoxX family membrane protein [Elusimicrobiales bacterium]